jgi:hypothetical protein
MTGHRFFALAALVLPLASHAQLPVPHRQLDSLLKELVEINTNDSAGHTADAAHAMAKRLTDAGFPASDVQEIGERRGISASSLAFAVEIRRSSRS